MNSTAVVAVLTIDGPVASGKGTVARAVSKALGFHLLDSGAIYRAFALAAINRNIDFLKINELEKQAKVLSLEFRDESVWLDGVDATLEIRSEAVGMMASKLSAIPEVRAALMDRQRAFAQVPGLVADGRDMGTVVFPDATLKIYLTATAEVRGARRRGQLQEVIAAESSEPSLDDVVANIRRRDLQDKTRTIAPLQPAADAIVIDNARHTKQETIAIILALWAMRGR
jgi:cytidylate kinase